MNIEEVSSIPDPSIVKSAPIILFIDNIKKSNVKKGVLLYAADEPTMNASGLTKPILIDSFPFKIGRKTNNTSSLTDLQITEQRPYYVSRNHLTLAIQNDDYILSDLESRKGTKVNNLMIGFNYPNSYVTLGDKENLIEIGSTATKGGRYNFVAEIVYDS